MEFYLKIFSSHPVEIRAISNNKRNFQNAKESEEFSNWWIGRQIFQEKLPFFNLRGILVNQYPVFPGCVVHYLHNKNNCSGKIIFYIISRQ